MSTPDISALLPPSLNLPTHLSAHKYFFVCTLTVAAWDTLVLSPRSWRLMKTKEWPVLKVIFHVLRFLMPAEFVIVAVAFFDTKWTLDMCAKFYLFEPIITMVLVSLCSAVHVIRVHAIYDKSRAILGGLGAVLLLQVAVMAACCAFYRVVPLLDGQGCIAGPQANWVGIYWAAPTLLYTLTFALALNRSFQSLQVKPLSPWKLMLRDGLNLYGSIWIVNMVNMLFWFIVKPTDDKDTIKTTVTSMAAVLTTTMTLRIILSVRGSLAQGGNYAGSTVNSSNRTTAHNLSGGAAVGTGVGARGGASAHAVSAAGGPHSFGPTPSTFQSGGGQDRSANVISINAGPGGLNTTRAGQPYTIDEMRSKPEREWVDSSDIDGKSSLADGKEGAYGLTGREQQDDSIGRGGYGGVKVTIDREVDYHRR